MCVEAGPGAGLWKQRFDLRFPPLAVGRALPLRLRCEFLLVWHCSGAVTQVQHLLFSCYYLGSALHAGGRAAVAFLVRGMGGGTKPTLVLRPHPSHHQPPAAHQPGPPSRASTLHPVPTTSHPAPRRLPSPSVRLRGCQLLPDVLPLLGVRRPFLALARVYTSSPVSEGCGGELGWGWEPERVADADAGRDPCPSFHGAPCRSSQGQQVPARRALSPSQRSLLRSGGNISCQDLSSPGCSLESVTAAADAQVFFAPSPWHPGGFFPQPDVPVPKIPLWEMLRASGCSGNRQSWQVPPGAGEKYPGWLIDSPEHGKSVHASDISPNLSCFATCPLEKKRKGSDSNKTVGRLLLLFF